MQIDVLPTGDPVHRYEKCIVVPFTGRRRVLSTCPFHGGYREDLTAVFNNDINPGPGMECRMLAAEYEEHIRLMAARLGLDPDTSAGMATAARNEAALPASQPWSRAESRTTRAGPEIRPPGTRRRRKKARSEPEPSIFCCFSMWI